MFRLIVISSLYAVLVSCGPKLQKKSKKEIYGEKSVGIPVPMMISQRVCADTIEDGELPQTELISRGDIVPYRVNFKKHIQVVRKMEFAGEFHSNSQFGLLVFPEIISAAKSFTLCPLEKQYEVNSYQDATVSILAPIKKFENTFPDIIKSLDLPKVKIRTAPLMKQGNRYLINNAFYYSGTNEITYLPQGYRDEKDTTLPFRGKPFWKFPMVALHEYGHHIFANIYKKSKPESIPHELPPTEEAPEGEELPMEEEPGVDLCYDNSSIHSEHESSADPGERRLVGKMIAVGALNEGFADIFAYYGDEKGRGLLKMGCLSKSRDVEFPSFRSGDQKVLTSSVMTEFLSPNYIQYGSCSRDTNYQDIHIIGAIYARAFYRALKTTPFTNEEKIELLLEWLQHTAKKAHDYDEPEEVLKLAVNEFYKLLKSSTVVTNLECIKYYSHFTGLMISQCF